MEGRGERGGVGKEEGRKEGGRSTVEERRERRGKVKERGR